jgi:hypothetical protein
MNGEYRQAVHLWMALNRIITGQAMCDFDDPILKSRDDLAYWIATYRMGQATYFEWFMVTQRAVDVLIGNTPDEMAA